jgi:hypothetical protein
MIVSKPARELEPGDILSTSGARMIDVVLCGHGTKVYLHAAFDDGATQTVTADADTIVHVYVPDALEPAVAAYIECALWAGLDISREDSSGNNPPLDENYGADDVDAAALAGCRRAAVVLERVQPLFVACRLERASRAPGWSRPPGMLEKEPEALAQVHLPAPLRQHFRRQRVAVVSIVLRHAHESLPPFGLPDSRHVTTISAGCQARSRRRNRARSIRARRRARGSSPARVTSGAGASSGSSTSCAGTCSSRPVARARSNAARAA